MQSVESVKFVLVGIGGYGAVFVAEMLNNTNRDISVSGAVDPYHERCIYYNQILENNIPVYKTLEEFYVERKADLAVIATPIFLHTENILTAIRNGS